MYICAIRWWLNTINSDCIFDIFYPQTKIYRRMYYYIILYYYCIYTNVRSCAFVPTNHFYPYIYINYCHYYIRKRTRTLVVVVWTTYMDVLFRHCVPGRTPSRDPCSEHIAAAYILLLHGTLPLKAYTHIELYITCMWGPAAAVDPVRVGLCARARALCYKYYFLHPPLESGVIAVPVVISYNIIYWWTTDNSRLIK